MCTDLEGADPGPTVVLHVPDDFASADQGPGYCGLSGRKERSVVVDPAAESLEDYRSENLDPYLDIGGDESVEDVELEQDVTYGDLTGDQLTYYAMADGRTIDVLRFQVGDLALTWITDEGDREADAEDIAATFASVAVVEGAPAMCRDARTGSAVGYALPPETTKTFPLGEDVCTVEITTEPPFASIDLFPPARSRGGGLGRERDRLQRDPRVTDVRYSPRTPGLGAEGRGERLTWTVRFQGRERFRVLLAQDGVRLRYDGTREQWSEDEKTFDDLRLSVTPP